MVLGTKMIEMKTPNNFNPVASIIIPTHERYELLINLLESLQTASDKFQKPIETIIVDSSSLELRTNPMRLQYLYVSILKIGIMYVRNATLVLK